MIATLSPFASLSRRAWILASLALCARLLLAAWQVGRLTHRAPRAMVDGEEVLLAETLGPASVGWRRPRIVLPSWVLSLDAPLRALVLRHEREHCRSGDSRLVWYAAIATALVPWNPGVWWIARRLRLALELDCDARTLAGGGDARVYAKLLLFMTQQHAAPSARTRLALSLAGSRSHLSRRIEAMQSARTNMSATSRVLVGAATIVAVAAACTTRIPGNVTMDDVVPPEPVVTTATEQPPYFEFQVEKPVALLGAARLVYPPVLRASGIEGTVLASFIVDENGRVERESFKVLRSDDPLFTEAVKAAVAESEYTAAELGGRRVRQLVQQPFAFAMGAQGAERLSSAGGSTVMVPDQSGRMPQTPGAGAVPVPRNLSEPQRPRSDVYFEFQVEKPASMVPGTNRMQYPTLLRSAQVEGQVLASFVVGEDGVPEASSFKVLKADHELFANAVRLALPDMRYTAAEAGGKRVKQLVQQPFVFQLAR